jgi:hypothetical protein
MPQRAAARRTPHALHQSVEGPQGQVEWEWLLVASAPDQEFGDTVGNRGERQQISDLPLAVVQGLTPSPWRLPAGHCVRRKKWRSR